MWVVAAAGRHNQPAKYMHQITSFASRGTGNWDGRHEHIAKKGYNFDLKNT